MLNIMLVLINTIDCSIDDELYWTYKYKHILSYSLGNWDISDIYILTCENSPDTFHGRKTSCWSHLNGTDRYHWPLEVEPHHLTNNYKFPFCSSKEANPWCLNNDDRLVQRYISVDIPWIWYPSSWMCQISPGTYHGGEYTLSCWSHLNGTDRYHWPV